MKSINLFCCLVILLELSFGVALAGDFGVPEAAAWMLDRTEVSAGPGQTVEIDIYHPGRYAIRPKSTMGAAITLVDPINGPGTKSGVTGKEDGRIDHFLDTGKYRLIIDGDPRETTLISIEVMLFRQTSNDKDLDITTTIQTDTLDDLDTCAYWFSREAGGPLRIQAAGRALGDIRIWRNGTWLMDATPMITESAGQTGQPLTVMTLITHLDPGSYCLKLYGARPLDWAIGGESNPLYIRTGIPTLPVAGTFTGSISIFGEELFHMPSKTDYFLLESTVVGTGIAVQEYSIEETTHGFSGTIRRIADANFPYQSTRHNWKNTQKLLRIDGTAGTPYRIRWFQEQPRRRKLDKSGKYSIRLYHGANEKDVAPLHAMVFQEDTINNSWKIIGQTTGRVSPESVYTTRFNLMKPVTLFLEFTEDGPYRIDSRGVPARYILEPYLLHPPKDYTQPLPKTFPQTEQIGAKVYKLTIQPDKFGSIDLMISAETMADDWSHFTPDSIDKQQTAVLKDLHLHDHFNYWLISNETNYVRGFSLDKNGNPPGVRYILNPDFPGGYPDQAPADNALNLRLNQFRSVTMNGHSTHMFKVNVQQAGIYQFETRSLLKTNCHFRSDLRVKLHGTKTRANGDNKIIRQYLAPGTYYATVTTAGGGPRPVEAMITRLHERHWGPLTPGQTANVDFTTAPVPFLSVAIENSAEYKVTCESLLPVSTLRLVDEDNWPVEILNGYANIEDIQAGNYRLFIVANPQVRSARVMLKATDPQDRQMGPGPHPLDLFNGGLGFWDTSDVEMTGQEWSFTLPASTRLNLSLTQGMIGELRRTGESEIFLEIPDDVVVSRDVDPDDWTLTVRPAIPDNRKPYEINTWADPLVSGFKSHVPIPGHVDLAFDSSWNESLLIVQSQANSDIRASLALSDVTGLNPITFANDDSVADWNPVFVVFPEDLSTQSLTGKATVHISPVTKTNDDCRVSMLIPPVKTTSIPVKGKQTLMTNGKTLCLSPDQPLTTGYWVVSATCPARFVMSGCQRPDTHHQLVLPASADLKVKLFELEGRNSPITITTDFVDPVWSNEKAGLMDLTWSTIPATDCRIAVAQQPLDRVGIFAIHRKGQVTREYLGASWNNQDMTPVYYTFQRVLPHEVPAPVQLERLILGQNTRSVIMPGNATIDYQVADEHYGVITLLPESGVNVSKIDFLQTYSGNHQLKPEDLLDTDRPDLRCAVTIEEIQLNSEVISGTPPGFRWLEPFTAVVLKPGAAPMQISLDSSVRAFEQASNTALSTPTGYTDLVSDPVIVINTAENRAGFAWSHNNTAVTELAVKTGKHGDNPAIFLGSAMMQSYEFELQTSQTIGAAVTCSGGHVQTQLSSVTLVEPLATGLVINKRLDPGRYRLDIWLPPGAPPSVAQLHLVLESPENLNKFGREE